MLTTSEPRQHALRGLSAHGFHRVVWHEWGEPGNPRVAICVHGLTRTGRDFDVLAEALAPTHRVLAVDMPGRGLSDWLPVKSDYAFPTYLTTLTALVAASGADRVDWVGTSMGGLLGMVIAAQPQTPIARLVVNDVGPAIEPAALERIKQYVGADPTFDTWDAFAACVRAISPFGPLTDAQWEHLTRTVGRERPMGVSDSSTTRASPHRFATHRRHRTSGPFGRRFAVRRCCSVAPRPTCFRPRLHGA